ncbi:unnamed protein product, partial [Heterotrigona itama]
FKLGKTVSGQTGSSYFVLVELASFLTKLIRFVDSTIIVSFLNWKLISTFGDSFAHTLVLHPSTLDYLLKKRRNANAIQFRRERRYMLVLDCYLPTNFKIHFRLTSAGKSSSGQLAVIKINICTDRSKPCIKEIKTTRAASSTRSHHAKMSG